jgi:hypothetical protein
MSARDMPNKKRPPCAGAFFKKFAVAFIDTSCLSALHFAEFSENFASQSRMNVMIRRNVFCLLISRRQIQVSALA